MDERTGIIYQIQNIVNGKSYVGQTVQTLHRRKEAHLSLLRRKVHANPHLQSNYDFYGKDCFLFTLIEDNVPYRELSKREAFWIEKLGAEFNISIPGHGPMFGRKHTKEALEKIGNASKGNKNRLGMKTSEETKAKMRASSPHYRHPPEVYARISPFKKGHKYNIGRKRSPEFIEKLRISRLGNKNCLGFKHTFETRVNMSNAQKNNKPVKQIDPKTGEVIKIWHSISWAGSQLGINRIVIARVANKKPNAITAGGYKWEYVNEY